MLVATNLGKRYGSRAVLRGLGFTVAPGTIAAVIGPNGAGKSTLLKIVAGLTPASLGSVCWREEDDEKKGRDLGWMCGLAAPDAPLPRELTVFENLEFLFRLRGGATESVGARRSRTENLLEAWQLGDRVHSATGDLSSGLRARLQLAAATLHAPRVLLLDEPSANLDEAGRAFLYAALRQQRERGIALVATNDRREAELCDVCIDVTAPQKQAVAA